MITDTVAFVLAFVSIYVPAAGGINCDGDCNIMRSGVPVFVGAAACDLELMRWEFCLDWAPKGMPLCYQCLDTGGSVRGPYIDLCYVPQVGQTTSEALAFALAWGSRRVPVAWYNWWGESRLEFCVGEQCIFQDDEEQVMGTVLLDGPDPEFDAELARAGLLLEELLEVERGRSRGTGNLVVVPGSM